MKKTYLVILSLIIIFVAMFFASYLYAKKQAVSVAQSFTGNLSPFKTQFALFGPSDLVPCWVFRAEYSDAMTGATFDVYISFFGKVKSIPPKSKMQD